MFIVFLLESDSGYSQTLLSHAIDLFHFADTFRGKYSHSIPEVQSFYKYFIHFKLTDKRIESLSNSINIDLGMDMQMNWPGQRPGFTKLPKTVITYKRLKVFTLPFKLQGKIGFYAGMISLQVGTNFLLS